MKKFVILLLVFAILSLTGCGLFGQKDGATDVGASLICEIANNSKPTKITTEVSFVTASGDSLSGFYVTVTDGVNTIFDYYYEKLATPAESLMNGNTDRVISYEGRVVYKDGAYFDGNGEAWMPGTGTAYDLRFNVDQGKLKDVNILEDGTSFEAKVAKEDLASFIGTDLNSVGDATVTVSTNGVNLTELTVSCNTANGTLTVRTSYTYNQQNLFPEAEG